MLEKRMECFRLLFDHLAWIEHQFLSVIRDSRKAGSLWGMIRGVGGVKKSIQQSWLDKGLGLGLLCRGFKGVQQEIPSEEASTLQIGSVAFPPGQRTSPQLHSIWPRWASIQFLSLPIVQTLLPVTFSYSLSSEAVVMRQLRRWRGCDDGHWHAHRRGLLWAFQKLFERYKKCPSEESLETYLMILVN